MKVILTAAAAGLTPSARSINCVDMLNTGRGAACGGREAGDAEMDKRWSRGGGEGLCREEGQWQVMERGEDGRWRG